jgi:hypothetical protein
MLYLVQLNYTIPVLKYFTGEGCKLDDSLIVHFVIKVQVGMPWSLKTHLNS